jgi:ferrous iron transport protein A
MAMGFDNGCEIKVERVAPLGDPYMVTVKGYNLALRRKDLDALNLKELEGTGV